ncbi:MAG TPA: hypothetical protein P5509_07030 [Bacteroidales bacterium]|nr:hypothetical protein [Bacteroidales bacterium]
MDNNEEIAQKQIDALNELKKEYGEDIVNQLYDELDKQHQFVDLGYGVMIVGNTLAIRYGKEYNPSQSISERYFKNVL